MLFEKIWDNFKKGLKAKEETWLDWESFAIYVENVQKYFIIGASEFT